VKQTFVAQRVALASLGVLLVSACGLAAPAGPSNPAPIPTLPSPARAGAAPVRGRAAVPGPATGDAPGRIRIGSTSSTEQLLLAELYAQVIEADGHPVERTLNLGQREVVEPALEAGQLDLYPEYLADLLAFVEQGGPGSSDPDEAHQRLRTILGPEGIIVLDYAPAVHTTGFVVSRTTAERYHLARLSDLPSVAGQLVLGGSPECPRQPRCMRGLQKTYGITFREFRPLTGGAADTVQALLGNQVDVAMLPTTDAAIALYGLVPLQDDQHLQLAENVAPVVRLDVLRHAPELKHLTASVSAKLTTPELAQLNKQVEFEQGDIQTVAAAWLRSKGLVP
jgi:osmoprotectant transport system substrate-binding protein